MRVKPDQITRAIQIAKAISERIDPAFSRVAMDIDPDSPLAQRMGMLRSIKRVEPYRPTEGFSRGGYAAGGTDQDKPYSQPDDMGLYSHAAVTAANLPQEKMSPTDMRQALLGRGVKESELKWGEYDYAFGDQPQVTRDEVAKHLWANMPPVMEKTFQRRQPGQPSLRDLKDKHYEERQRLWDEEDAAQSDPADLNQRRREMRARHMAERRSAWQGDPYHENLTIPGGENYREILLKHGSGDMYPGVSAHFGGEPDVLASMMVKDRTDHEGDKVLHIDELQSDWAQRGRKVGFGRDPETSQRLISDFDDYRHALRDRAIDRISQTLSEKGATSQDAEDILEAIMRENNPLHLAHWAGGNEEVARYQQMQEAAENARKGITPAPYVTKTEDWVDLGLKRALREAAEKGYDKLAWSPGHVIADRYDLAKHVDQIRHARNDDGTYDLRVDNLQGDRVFGKDGMSPEEVESHLGKGMAEKIMAGHGDPDENPTNRDWRTLRGVDLHMGEKWPFEMYDRMIPKRALRLAKQHDPDAQFEQSVITHGGGFNFGSAASEGKQTALHAIRITPQMRESILRKGFAAYAEGGEVRDHKRLGGAEEGDIDPAIAPEQDHPLTQDVYHGTKEIMVGPARAWETGQEMFQARNPKDVSFLPNVTALSLGPHVARDPNISGHERFTTGENLDLSTDEKPVPLKAQGKVMMLKTFPHERFYQVPQNIKEDVRSVNPADRDDNAVHNFVFDVVLRRDPELAKRVVQQTYGLEDDEAKKFVEGFTSPDGVEDPFSPGHRYPSLAHFLRYNNLTVNPKDHDLIIKKFRKVMRDKGYVGLSYSNTDPSEIRKAKDRTCYIVFPQRDKETGWSPLRLKGAKFDPERRGRPGLHEADGGAVEGYAYGGMPPPTPDEGLEEEPEQEQSSAPAAPANPNGGLLFPQEDTQARLTRKLKREAKTPESGEPKNPRTIIRPPEPENPDDPRLPEFVAGKLTFDDWKKRHENILSDQEIHHSAAWYKNILGNFMDYYGVNQAKAKNMMRAWLVAQQNVSPAGAMQNVLLQKEQMARGVPEHLWRAAGMPNPTAAARSVLRDQPIGGGVGQKIADFVDSAEGKNTRAWMGDHPHGGEPFVVDVHTARDMGMVDQELINHLERAGYNPDDLKKLQIDFAGTPTENTYENRGNFGRELTKHLNQIGWKGRNDWTPAEVQAVGWMGMTKLTRNAEEDSESGLGRNLRRISYELAPGEGSPWEKKYGEAFAAIPKERQYALTRSMSNAAMRHAQRLAGIDINGMVHGTGAWENYQNPSAVGQTLATEHGADIAANALGHLLQQTEVWHNRVKPVTTSPKGFAIDFIEDGSKNLADESNLRDFWGKVMGADASGIIRGYQPITLPSGQVGIRALIDKGGAGTHAKLQKSLEPGGALDAMLTSMPFNVKSTLHEAEIRKARNDWKENPNGEAYISRLIDLLGSDPSASLNRSRAQLEQAFERLLDDAHKGQGTSWRKAKGGKVVAKKAGGPAINKALLVSLRAAKKR